EAIAGIEDDRIQLGVDAVDDRLALVDRQQEVVALQPEMEGVVDPQSQLQHQQHHNGQVYPIDQALSPAALSVPGIVLIVASHHRMRYIFPYPLLKNLSVLAPCALYLLSDCPFRFVTT